MISLKEMDEAGFIGNMPERGTQKEGRLSETCPADETVAFFTASALFDSTGILTALKSF